MWQRGAVKGVQCVINNNVTFPMLVRCFHPVTSINGGSLWSRSGCFKWIRGCFSFVLFLYPSPLNKHQLRERVFSSEPKRLIWWRQQHSASTCLPMLVSHFVSAHLTGCVRRFAAPVRLALLMPLFKWMMGGPHWARCFASAPVHITA